MAKKPEVTGMRELVAQLRARKQETLKRFKVAMWKGGLALLGFSQEIVPVDKGVLRASGRCLAPKMEGSKVVVTVEYTANYAIYVHEDLEARHGADYNAWHGEEIAAGKKKARGENQQAKFLEQPARTRRHEIRQVIRENM